MSEEEILKEIDIIKTTIEDILQIDIDNYIEDIYKIDTRQYKAIQFLLDLYKKEKEKNKWKPISEYNREKYDWVLVKYFDGDYECVPEVAEQRCDGKWYTSEREIPFEVKYFFDIQELLEERN